MHVDIQDIRSAEVVKAHPAVVWHQFYKRQETAVQVCNICKPAGRRKCGASELRCLPDKRAHAKGAVVSGTEAAVSHKDSRACVTRSACKTSFIGSASAVFRSQYSESEPFHEQRLILF